MASASPLHLCFASSRSVHFQCERQRSPSAHLVRRRGGTPCWIPFSLAVPGFALRNRFRVVRDLCFTVVEGPLCAQSPIYFLIQRQRSPSRHLWRVGVQRLVGFHFHWLFLASLSEIVSAGFVTFVFQWWRVRRARGGSLFSDPTSAFRLEARFGADSLQRLVRIFISLRLHNIELIQALNMPARHPPFR